MPAANQNVTDISITRKAITNKPGATFIVSHPEGNEARTCLHFITFGIDHGPTQVDHPPAILKLNLSGNEPPPEHLCDRFTGLNKEIAESFFSIRANEATYQWTLREIEQKMSRRPPGGCAVILINCRAGWHRSVAMSERLAEAVRRRDGFKAECLHLDLAKNNRIRAEIAVMANAAETSEDEPARGRRRWRHQAQAMSEARVREKRTRGAAAAADTMLTPIIGPLRRKTVLCVSRIPVPKPRPQQRCSAISTFQQQYLQQQYRQHLFLNIKHQGVAAFRKDATYQVFRNVKDFGAKGDGVSDDTAAINLAISSGGRCGPKTCQSSTTSPAVVYFPVGVYRISAPIIDYYYTQMIGNPNDLPTVKATSNFTAFALIDGDQYQPGNAANPAGSLGFNSTNVFYRQIRNLILDTTSAASNVSVNGIHWPTAQATSLQNIIFRLSDAPGTQHQGIFIEAGSGGFMSDLVFYGGLAGAFLGNQQFTSRNLSFHNSVQAINQIWDWGWTYKSIKITNCSVGLNMSSGGPSSQAVGSVTFIDSTITDTPIGILTAHDSTMSTFSNGSLILENVHFTNVRTAIQGPRNTTALAGTSGSMEIAAWGQGHQYTPTGPASFQGVIPAFPRPAGLTSGKTYYQRSKPSYSTTPVSNFLSTRASGAKGDGIADDTAALQKTINAAALDSQIVFVDAGTYRITATLHVPRNTKLVGESYSVIMSSGPFFNSVQHPRPVVRIGQPGEVGRVEWSDMVVATQGPQAGAVLVEWNLATAAGDEASGMWDVHTRIGGFAGSQLQTADCPAPVNSASHPNMSTPTAPSIPFQNASSAASWNSTARPPPPPPARTNTSCTGAYMSMHISATATGLYMENVWLWTADHDLDSTLPKGANTNITIHAGRGLHIESAKGNIWLVGTAVEHHALYQYQLAHTRDIFLGQLQTETPYYQPSSPPHPSIPHPHDPPCPATAACSARALRILNSDNINVYGAGLYSFYHDYNTACSTPGNGEACQDSLLSIDGPRTRNVNMYNLNTIGAASMITRDGTSLADYSDNVDVFPDGIAVFRLD